jgi:hypothetical protein
MQIKLAWKCKLYILVSCVYSWEKAWQVSFSDMRHVINSDQKGLALKKVFDECMKRFNVILM